VALEVLDGGLLTTVQDLGRTGYERYGVPVAGAMDPFALRAANLLVGNPLDAAALEITLAGPRLRATEKCLIAVAGADLGLRMNGWELPPWMAVFVRRGWTIEFGGRKAGCRAVLAVAGGIDVGPVMGSHSTYLSGGFGGLEGRALRRGDLVPVGPTDFPLPTQAGLTFPRRLIPAYSDTPEIRVVLGPQDDCFTDEGIATFLSSEYRGSSASDRMGCRLQGTKIAHKGPAGIISDGIPLGAVQVPPDGQPIIMLADRQATGGYPKIATVISADIPLLAQCVPGQSSVRFKAVGVEEAQVSYREMMEALTTLV
jgi:antagonist of KipI